MTESAIRGQNSDASADGRIVVIVLNSLAAAYELT